MDKGRNEAAKPAASSPSSKSPSLIDERGRWFPSARRLGRSPRGPGWDAHALLFSVIRCLSTYKPIRCSFCVHNKAGQNAFYERVLSSEKWLLKESDSLHMRFQFAQGLVVLGFFSSIQVMKILTLFQTKKLCLSFQQSFPRTRAHSVAFRFSSLSFFIFFF